MGTIRKTGDHWVVEFITAEEGAKVPRIIEAIQAGKKKSNLPQKVIETLTTEPIKAVFTILAAIIGAFLLWYFGLA